MWSKETLRPSTLSGLHTTGTLCTQSNYYASWLLMFPSSPLISTPLHGLVKCVCGSIVCCMLWSRVLCCKVCALIDRYYRHSVDDKTCRDLCFYLLHALQGAFISFSTILWLLIFLLTIDRDTCFSYIFSSKYISENLISRFLWIHEYSENKFPSKITPYTV